MSGIGKFWKLLIDI